MIRRRGVTLLEVLIAIFVMAIGMLALLVLFPLGALSMAQALKDNRCQQAVANAQTVATVLDLRNDVNVTTKSTTPGGTFAALNSVAGYDGPGYPVYVDPFGSLTVGGFLGGTAPVPRVNPQSITTLAAALPWFTLTDDTEFDANGQTVFSGPQANGTVKRNSKFSWAYLVRRPRWSDPSAAEVAVVVYGSRPLRTAAKEDLYSAVAYTTDPTAAAFGNTSLTLDLTSNPKAPNLRVGSWLMDVSSEYDTPNNKFFAEASLHGPAHSYFYRVVSVSENAGLANAVRVELQTPLRAGTRAPPSAFMLQFAVLDDVVEVFDKGSGRKP